MNPDLQRALQRIVRLSWEITQADPHEQARLFTFLEDEVTAAKALITPTVVGTA